MQCLPVTIIKRELDGDKCQWRTEGAIDLGGEASERARHMSRHPERKGGGSESGTEGREWKVTEGGVMLSMAAIGS